MEVKVKMNGKRFLYQLIDHATTMVCDLRRYSELQKFACNVINRHGKYIYHEAHATIATYAVGKAITENAKPIR